MLDKQTKKNSENRYDGKKMMMKNVFQKDFFFFECCLGLFLFLFRSWYLKEKHTDPITLLVVSAKKDDDEGVSFIDFEV